MKKLEASKVIIIVMYILMFLVVGFSGFLAVYTKNAQVFLPVIAGTFVLAASATGFYYWKAKAENMEKIRIDRENRKAVTVDMKDIMSIKDDTAMAMSAAMGNIPGFDSSMLDVLNSSVETEYETDNDLYDSREDNSLSDDDEAVSLRAAASLTGDKEALEDIDSVITEDEEPEETIIVGAEDTSTEVYVPEVERVDSIDPDEDTGDDPDSEASESEI